MDGILTIKKNIELREQQNINGDDEGEIFETVHLKNDGSLLKVEVSAKMFTNEKQKYYQTIIREISNRKNTESVFYSKTECKEKSVEMADVMIIGLDIEGNIKVINDIAELTTGYSITELNGKNWYDVLVPKYRYHDEWIKSKRVQENDWPIEHEGSIITKMGEERNILWHNCKVNDGNSVIGTVSLGIDITERRAFELKVNEASQFNKQIVNGAQEGIVVYGLDFRYLVWNPFMEKATGYKAEQVLGKKPNEVFYYLGEMGVGENLERVLLGQTVGPDEFLFTIKENRKERWVSVKTAPLLNTKNEIIGIIKTFSDITTHKNTQKKLELYKKHLLELVKIRTEELNKSNTLLKGKIEKEKQIETMLRRSLGKEKELNELKTKFISTMSHEFRTPLTSILSSTELLQRYGKKWSKEKFEEHVIRVKHSIVVLTKLLDDVLTISHSESGKIVSNPEDTDLERLCSEIVEEHKCIMKHGQDLIFEYSPGEKIFSIDPKFLRYIINNLLSNAVKYTLDEGIIRFTVGTKADRIEIVISDNGIGIPEEDIKHIYEPFHRAKNSEDIQGTGLGLAIVKHAIDLHGGSIKCKSEIGNGTTFIIELPRSK